MGKKMTAGQYRKAIKILGMSQVRASAFLGIAPRTSQGYALEEYPIPTAIAKLLDLCIKLKYKPKETDFV